MSSESKIRKRQILTLLGFTAGVAVLAWMSGSNGFKDLKFYPYEPPPGTTGTEGQLYLWSIIKERILVLGILAIFLERSLEIIMTTWRGSRPRTLGAELHALEEEFNLYEKREASGSLRHQKELQRRMKPLKKELAEHKQVTQKFSMWIALALGCLIAGFGVSLLRDMIQDFHLLNPLQYFLIAFVDILLTGRLLAGGSDLFHKLMEI